MSELGHGVVLVEVPDDLVFLCFLVLFPLFLGPFPNGVAADDVLEDLGREDLEAVADIDGLPFLGGLQRREGYRFGRKSGPMVPPRLQRRVKSLSVQTVLRLCFLPRIPDLVQAWLRLVRAAADLQGRQKRLSLGPALRRRPLFGAPVGATVWGPELNASLLC